MSKIKLQSFGATWCTQCRNLEPQLKELAAGYPEVEIEKVDIDEQPDLAGQRGIMGVPMTFVIVDGEDKDKFAGFRPATAIEELVRKHI